MISDQALGQHSRMGTSTVAFAVAVASFSVMSIEILAFRFFAPVFGSSIQTTSMVVTVVMLAMAIGALVAGKMRSLQHREARALAYCLGAGMAFTVVIAFAHVKVLQWMSVLPKVTASALAAVVVLCPIAVSLSMTTPLAVQLMATRGSLGSTTGRLYALSSFASIVAVYLTTYGLAPYIGVRNSLLLNAGLLFASMLICYQSSRRT